MSTVTTITTAERRTPGDITLRQKLKTLVESGLSTTRVAVETGITVETLESWLRGAGAEDIDERLAAWLAEREQAAAAQEPGYFDTPTAERIFQALDAARESAGISLIYGGAGCGKTTAAKRYVDHANRRTYNRPVYYVRASAFVTTPTAILEEIAEAMGLYGNAYRLMTLVRDIRRKLYPGDLLIVDEAQYLEPKALDALRDFTGEPCLAGLAYLGNEEVHTRIDGVGRRARFAQLSSRVVDRVHVPAPTESDVDAFLAAWGIAGKREREFAVLLGTTSGGLRVLEQVVRQARKIAHLTRTKVDIKLLKATARHGGWWSG